MLKFAEESKKDKLKKRIAGLSVGGVIGFINGFFGGGAGMLLVPAIGLLYGCSVKQSHATAIAAVLPMTLASTAIYYFEGVGAGEAFRPASLGVVAGGILGAVLLKKLSSKWIGAIFNIIMIAAGVRLIIG